MPNRLQDSTSPYLNQHAENPVDWYPWSEEAWNKAKTEDKPVFLSIGYSSCHWCHVMAHESFEDQETADILNQHFINIKVDREERPDIDEIYMTAVQLATGHGGWPMSLFLTPDQKPFFAGTYFPKETRDGFPSFKTIALNLADAWQSQRTEINERSDEFANGLAQVFEKNVAPVTDQIDTTLLDSAIQQFHTTFDYENGGFGDHPKFPPHTLLNFLINFAQNRHLLPGDPNSIEALTSDAGHMAVLTLRKMASGGIHDIVGGGFHRYATDNQWLLPHFEKMLYDNAQLLAIYATAKEVIEDETIKNQCQEVVDHLVTWVGREMSAPDNTFYSAIDADSTNEDLKSEEGAFYTWTHEELASVLSEEQLETYNIYAGGNFADEATQELTGKNILHTTKTVTRPKEFDELLKLRQNRIAPQTDHKAICASNGLMIGALALAGATELATAAADTWLNFPSEELPHQIVNSNPQGHAFLDDYAFLIDGLIDLAVATKQQKYAECATELAKVMVERFADPIHGGFTYTSRQHEKLIGQTKPAMDNSSPSPNGIAIKVLRRLNLNQASLNHLTAMYGWAQRLPQANATLLNECLEQLLIANSDQITTQSASPESLQVILEPKTPKLAKDGFAYTSLEVKVPSGMHINSTNPPTTWLTPTAVEVNEVYGEAGFPEATDEKYSGNLTIMLRLKPKSTVGKFSVKFTFQLCSEQACYLPQTVELIGEIKS